MKKKAAEAQTITQNTKNIFRSMPKWLLGILGPLTLFVLILFIYVGFLGYYHQRIYPGVKVAGIHIGGYRMEKGYQLLQQEFSTRSDQKLTLEYQNNKYSLDLKSAQPQLNAEESIKLAYKIGRSGVHLKDLENHLNALFQGITIEPDISYTNRVALDQQLEIIYNQVKKHPVNAQIQLGKDSITITPSEEGIELDKSVLLDHIHHYLAFQESQPTLLPIKVTQAFFTTKDAEIAKQALEYTKEHPLELVYKDKSWTINQKTLYGLLNLDQIKERTVQQDNPNGNASTTIKNILDEQGLSSFLKELADEIYQPVQEAKFTIDQAASEPAGLQPTNKKIRVKEFQAAQLGQELDIPKTADLISQALVTQQPGQKIELPVKITQPKTTTEEVNNFGIQELIGQGISHFSGSIPNRIYNVGLAAAKINGTLIPPGEVFSFNNTVGDISSASGYKQAYVIKSGRTVLDDGGGVCQVSTTIFRAALNTGLPIVERTAHAYRVGYYEQGFAPGLDATIFQPSVDFKFKNDTTSYILVQAQISGTTLTIDFYGTSDGRKVALSTSKILSQTPPLPEIRQDDPTLPKGTIKQVDWAASGANVTFTRTVTREGQTLINETFRSNYRPWQAVYLVGTL